MVTIHKCIRVFLDYIYNWKNVVLWDSDLVVFVSDLQFVILVSENLLNFFHLVHIMKLDCKTFIAPFFLQVLKGRMPPFSAIPGLRHMSLFSSYQASLLLLFFKTSNSIFMTHVQKKSIVLYVSVLG